MTTVIEILSQYDDLFIKETKATLYMTFFSTLYAYIFGLPLGVILTITEPGSLTPRPILYHFLNVIVNIGRSIPYIILIIALIPVTRTIVGTMLGPKAATVSLTIAAIPFVARLVESSLKELDPGIIEAAESMGASILKMIFGVILPEALPSIIRGISLTTITVVGYSAMAGAVGGGGLGDVAIRYGYHRYNTGVMMVTLVLLVLLVQFIQVVGDITSRLIDKQKSK